MSYEYLTTVGASLGFWDKHTLKKIDRKGTNKISNISTNEIAIYTTNRTPLNDIIILSEEYPLEVFQVKIVGEDLYENYVYLYECSKGESKLIKEGYEYCFTYKTKDRARIEKDFIKKFERKVADCYQRMKQNSKYDVKLEMYFDESPDDIMDNNISLIVEYKSKDLCLTARKFGLTHIMVDVEFFDETKNPLLMNCHSKNESAELPI